MWKKICKEARWNILWKSRSTISVQLKFLIRIYKLLQTHVRWQPPDCGLPGHPVGGHCVHTRPQRRCQVTNRQHTLGIININMLIYVAFCLNYSWTKVTFYDKCQLSHNTTMCAAVWWATILSGWVKGIYWGNIYAARYLVTLSIYPQVWHNEHLRNMESVSQMLWNYCHSAWMNRIE